MKFDQLQYFLEAAKFEHIGKAAKSLSISPSAISHSIALLEEELGRELFIKRGKQIQLTSHGQLLMEKARGILEQVEKVREEIQSDQVELQGNYRLAASHWLCSEILTPAWVQVQEKSSLLTCEIQTLRSADVVAEVVSGHADLGLCFSPQDHPQIGAQKLLEGQLVIGVAKNHTLAKKPVEFVIKELGRYFCVLPKAFQGIDVCERNPVFQKHGIELKPDMLVDSYEVMLEKIAHSDSWGFLPDFILNSRKDSVTRVALPKNWQAPFYVSALWPRNRILTSSLKSLISVIEKRIQK